MLAHVDDNFETPESIMNEIKKKTGINFHLDVCATKNNTKCRKFFTKKQDALSLPSWKILRNGKQQNIFCNPPRSLNGRFVKRLIYEWITNNYNIVLLLTWNDFGNKYGNPLIDYWKNNEIEITNLGKVYFAKKNKVSKFPSRLTYCWIWFKAKDITITDKN